MEPLNSHTQQTLQKCWWGQERNISRPWPELSPRALLCLNQAKQTLAKKPKAEKNLNELAVVTLLKGHWGRQRLGIPEGISCPPGALFPVGPLATSGWMEVLALPACRCWVSHKAFLPPTHLLPISCLLPSIPMHSAPMATYEFPLERKRWGFIATGCQLPLVPPWSSYPCSLPPHTGTSEEDQPPLPEANQEHKSQALLNRDLSSKVAWPMSFSPFFQTKLCSSHLINSMTEILLALSLLHHNFLEGPQPVYPTLSPGVLTLEDYRIPCNVGFR